MPAQRLSDAGGLRQQLGGREVSDATGTEFPECRSDRQIAMCRNADRRRELIDANGHMNVLHYLEFGSSAADALVRQVGIDDAYRADRRLGFFTAEHHLRCYSELFEHGAVDVHARVLDRSAKVVHMMPFVLDRRRQRLSGTLEPGLVHVDLTRRRPVAMPADVAAGLDDYVACSSRLDWAAPLCGTMGVRG